MTGDIGLPEDPQDPPAEIQGVGEGTDASSENEPAGEPADGEEDDLAAGRS